MLHKLCPPAPWPPARSSLFVPRTACWPFSAPNLTGLARTAPPAPATLCPQAAKAANATKAERARQVGAHLAFQSLEVGFRFGASPRVWFRCLQLPDQPATPPDTRPHNYPSRTQYTCTDCMPSPHVLRVRRHGFGEGTKRSVPDQSTFGVEVAESFFEFMIARALV